MTGFEPLDETLVHDGVVISIYDARFRSPDGSVVHREIARHPGAVGVVPIVGDSVVLVRQYRAPLDRDLLEIPAGKMDVPGEDPAVTAVRELQEEAGLAPGELIRLGSFWNTPGFCDEYSHLFLATGCVEVDDDRQGAEEEAMTIERLPLSGLHDAIGSGAVTDGKTIIGLLLAARHLGL
jgi:ADP-ribose pyrophosphatase